MTVGLDGASAFSVAAAEIFHNGRYTADDQSPLGLDPSTVQRISSPPVMTV
jgi:hypothetical protein